MLPTRWLLLQKVSISHATSRVAANFKEFHFFLQVSNHSQKRFGLWLSKIWTKGLFSWASSFANVQLQDVSPKCSRSVFRRFSPSAWIHSEVIKRKGTQTQRIKGDGQSYDNQTELWVKICQKRKVKMEADPHPFSWTENHQIRRISLSQLGGFVLKSNECIWHVHQMKSISGLFPVAGYWNGEQQHALEWAFSQQSGLHALQVQRLPHLRHNYVGLHTWPR